MTQESSRIGPRFKLDWTYHGWAGLASIQSSVMFEVVEVEVRE